MAKIDIKWVRTEYPIKLGEFAKEFGVDITTLAEHNVNPFEVFSWLETKVRGRILEEVACQWDDNKPGNFSEFGKVKKGVYVITLASNIAIDYGGKNSQVLYIGRGALKERFSAHLKKWIPAITNSIYDFGLVFWMTEIKKQGNADLFKEVESDLIESFRDEFRTLPLQNSINGKGHNKYHTYENGWKTPFKRSHRLKNGWAIKPLANNPWAMKFDDD